jgi:hypothetical protein
MKVVLENIFELFYGHFLTTLPIKGRGDIAIATLANNSQKLISVSDKPTIKLALANSKLDGHSLTTLAFDG